MRKIPIRVLREFAKKYGYTHIIMFATDEKLTQYIATYGRSITDCDEAARAGDRLKDAFNWPQVLHAVPSRVRQLQKRIKELEAKLHAHESQRNLSGMSTDQSTSTIIQTRMEDYCPGCGALLPVHAYACPYDTTYPKSKSDKEKEDV
jgi:hypothetical protein